MITTLLAYPLLGIFFLSEGRVRVSTRARKLDRTADDRSRTGPCDGGA